MEKIKISTAQFEHKSGDKAYNLSVIEALTKHASLQDSAECRTLGDDIISAVFTPEKLTQAGGYRYSMARRPVLYNDIIGQSHQSQQKVIWLNNK